MGLEDLMKPLIYGLRIFGSVAVLTLAACASGNWDDEQRNQILQEYVARGYPADFRAIARRLRSKADNGSARAQSDLGFLHANGWGVPKDDAEAARWYLKAGIAGDGRGKYNLAVMYLMGKGVPQDYGQAQRWMLEAAFMGHGPASAIRSCLMTGKSGVKLGPAPRIFEDRPTDTPQLKRDAGLFYWQRSCDPADTAKAIGLLRQSAAAGLPKAEYMLGIAYRQGRGVGKNLAQSATWFRRAGAQDHNAARLAFCRLHRAGHAPGPGNELRAREWCG